MQQTSEGAIERARGKHPAVCYLFDCLYLDGRAIINEPLIRRREWLEDAIRNDTAYRVSQAVEEGTEFFDAIQQMGLEGVMAKLRQSAYQPGKRSESWFKIKTRQTVECVIIGYTRGKGDRESAFGALHLAQANGRQLEYIGKVGGGFDEQTLKAVYADIIKLPKVPRPVKQKSPDEARTVWIEPKLICEVEYGSLSSEGLLREPVFVRMRPDMSF
jgi:ATP-dependent DNA ligase